MEHAAIRPGREADLEQLTDIYNYYIINTPITFDLEPFSVEKRRGWFLEHMSSGLHQLLVAEEAGTVIGYVTSSRFRPKDAYVTSVETSIYLAPEAKGKGIGTGHPSVHRTLCRLGQTRHPSRLRRNNAAKRGFNRYPPEIRLRRGGSKHRRVSRGRTKIWAVLGR